MTALASMSNTTLLQADDIVLCDVTLAIDAGTLWRIEGSNGAGKTTLLEAIAGLVAFDGVVAVAGRPPGSMAARELVSYAPAEAALFHDKTVDEHVGFVLGLFAKVADGPPVSPTQVVDGLGLQRLGGRFPGELSTGDRKKLSVVLALVRPFDLLLLDEPFVHLDREAGSALEDVLRALVSDAGKAVCFASHGTELEDELTGRLRLEAGRASVVQGSGS